MRTNYFVGVEGTHGIIRKVLEVDDRTELFETFFGADARSRVDATFEETIDYLFGEITDPYATEYNIGITRQGAVGPMLSTLLAKSPVGSRVFFFKSTDNTETAELHKAFLKISASRARPERLSGMTEEALAANPEAYTEAALEAVSQLNGVADQYGATAWAPFDTTAYFDGSGDPGSKILFRLFVKT